MCAEFATAVDADAPTAVTVGVTGEKMVGDDGSIYATPPGMASLLFNFEKFCIVIVTY